MTHVYADGGISYGIMAMVTDEDGTYGPASMTIVSWFFEGGPDIDFADLAEAKKTGEVLNIEFDTSPSSGDGEN